MSKKMRTGDSVLVTTGNEKGRTGKIISRTGDYAVIQGLNLKKKHVKRTEENPKGGIIELEKPIHLSNLRIVVGDNQPVKLRSRFNDENIKEYVYKSGGEDIVYRSSKKGR